MVEAAWRIEFSNRGKFPHQYSQSPELHGVTGPPYTPGHRVGGKDPSILGGHPDSENLAP